MMKLFRTFANIVLTITALLIVAGALTSCEAFKKSTPNNGSVTTPDPEDIKVVLLYSDTGDNLAGIYYDTDGKLKSTNGWQFATVGTSFGNVGSINLIPWGPWSDQLTAYLYDGIIGYHPSNGFMRMFIPSIARNESGVIVGVAVAYDPNFFGKKENIALSTTSVNFPAEGGEQVINVKNDSYVVYQAHGNAPWCKSKTWSTAASFTPNRITITCEPNTDGAARQSNVIVENYYGNQTRIYVKQAAAQSDEDDN